MNLLHLELYGCGSSEADLPHVLAGGRRLDVIAVIYDSIKTTDQHNIMNIESFETLIIDYNLSSLFFVCSCAYVTMV